MSYLKLLQARSRSGRQPTIEPHRFTPRQKELAEDGLCVRCGKASAGAHSFLCKPCESEDTIDEIRADLAALRRKILNKSGE